MTDVIINDACAVIGDGGIFFNVKFSTDINNDWVVVKLENKDKILSSTKLEGITFTMSKELIEYLIRELT